MKILSIVLAIGACLGARALVAEAAVDIPRLLSKGINMDHYFEPYQGSWDPKLTFGEEQRKAMEGKLKEAEFAQVAGLGFSHVRLNFGRAFIQEQKAPYKLRPEGLALLDKAVGYALKNNLGIILDLHQIPPPDIFHDKEALKAFKTMWKGLAAHFAGRPPQILFELLNEPNVKELNDDGKVPNEADQERWRKLLKDVVGAIRKEDPERYVVVTSGGWGGGKGLMRMGNLGLPKLVYSFHCYEPMLFTHQGATWSGEALKGLKGIQYPMTEKAMKALLEKARHEKKEEWPFTQYPQGYDKAAMEAFLKPVIEFGKKEGLTLYCGEFGVHRPHAPKDARARWIKDMVGILGGNGVAWSMWAFHSGFDLVNEKGQADPAIVKALGLKN